MSYKKSYYKDGIYIDTTTNREYQPKQYCEICGAYWVRLDVHHYLDQQKCLRDLKTIEIGKTVTPNTWTQEFINENQKLFTLCRECHTKVHNCHSNRVINGKKLKDFVYRNEEKQPITNPIQKAFVVKRGNDVRDKQDL